VPARTEGILIGAQGVLTHDERFLIGGEAEAGFHKRHTLIAGIDDK
jgi:hypothetical protein